MNRVKITYQTPNGRTRVANSSLKNGAKVIAFLINVKSDIKKVVIK